MDNKDLIQQFLDYRVNYYNMAPDSYNYYGRFLNDFCNFLDSRGECLMSVNHESFLSYRNMMMLKYRNATIQVKMAVLASFYKWLCLPSIGYTEHNLMPQIEVEQAARHPNFVPTAKEIFTIRASQNAKTLIGAALFEVLLSSGMRISECLQIRWCDLNFNHGVKDYEFNKTSPFVGASINLSAGRGLRIKRGAGKLRVTFMSRLAAKLLNIHAEQCNLDTESIIPVFALIPQNHRKVIWDMGTHILRRRPEANIPRHRKHGFLDIDVDALDAPKEYKDKIRAAQKRERDLMKKFPNRERMARIEPSRKITLHPHSLRHFFAICQYHRNYYGNRHDAVSIRDMLGHSSIKVSDSYLQSGNHVEDDRQWKQIMLGNGFDYKRFFYK